MPHSKLEFVDFSLKQNQILSWWHDLSPVCDAVGLIADGSIRAGKTLPMAYSFIEWAFYRFDGQVFGMAGKTIDSFKRNVTVWLLPLLRDCGYTVVERLKDNAIHVSGFGKSNTFIIFGGRDESSQNLVQGVTLAGFLFDEVALMPESFVNQATGRCSVTGSKWFFNCNPGGSSHWFLKEWLNKASLKGLLHLHFTMDDNPSLSNERRKVYASLYTGVFYRRYIQGLWVAAEGAIWDCFSENNLYDFLPYPEEIWEKSVHSIAIDYGTQNATVFLHIMDDGNHIWVDAEWYHSGRDLETGGQKTDSQYAEALKSFIGVDDDPEQKPIQRIYIDPSAASFKAELRSRRIRTRDADNEVLDGIRTVGSCIQLGMVMVNRRCVNLIREIGGYVWNPKLAERGVEEPIKKDDHTCDALRYYIKSVVTARRLLLFSQRVRLLQAA